MRSPVVRYAVACIVAAPLAGLPACTDSKATNEAEAAAELDKIAPLVDSDTTEVRRGLPEGAKKLGELIDADPGANLAALQQAIARARDQVHDLQVAKSTFFSFMDPSGTVLRSEADPDLLASKNVFAAFPSLKKSLESPNETVEAYGAMNEMRGIKTGQDTAWVVARAVVDKQKKVAGAFITGWSFRRYAYRLEDQAKRDLSEQAQKDGKKSAPIAYVFVVKAGKAYGAPVTPDVNAEAIESLDVVGKTASGPLKTSIDVTGRSFGVAAKRAPALGDDAAVAIMLSEI